LFLNKLCYKINHFIIKVFFLGFDLDDTFLLDLAALPEGRNGIRAAVESYRHSLSAFKEGLNGVFLGRSVTYSYHSHQFHPSKKTTMPTENVMISWEKDHFVHAVKIFASEIFQGQELNNSEFEERKRVALSYLGNTCLRDLSDESAVTAEHLRAAKEKVEGVIKNLLGKACAFEAVVSSTSVPAQSTDSVNMLRSFHAGVQEDVMSTYHSFSSSHSEESVEFSTPLETDNDEVEMKEEKQAPNLIIRFLMSLRMAILRAFNWFVDQFV